MAPRILLYRRNPLFAGARSATRSGAERGEPGLDLVDAAALRQLAEGPAIGRNRLGLLASELLRAREPQDQLFVMEILRAPTRQRHLERFDRLRVVAPGLPRVGDAAQAQRLERARGPLGDGDLPGAASLGVLLGVIAEAAELVGHLRGAGARGILRQHRLELADRCGARLGAR